MGKVNGDAKISLRFKAGDMSDLLKSLTVLDLDGGSIRAIAYESTKTVDQQLGEYTFNLRAAQGLPAILEQMKGSDGRRAPRGGQGDRRPRPRRGKAGRAQGRRADGVTSSPSCRRRRCEELQADRD